MMNRFKLSLLVCLCVPAGASQAELFQPDAAVASSEFSSSYDIGNAIDGSALSADFTPDSVHGDYQVNNHWTTRANETIGEFADFLFDDSKTIGTFHFWNHRSNVISANSLYEITEFDLQLFNEEGDELFALIGATAVGETAVAQSYTFAPVDDVARVRFTVRNTQGDEQGISRRFTGFGEVAFEAVPEPSSGVLLFSALGMLAARRRARRS